MRTFVPFAIKSLNDNSIDFFARGKCIDWLGVILEWIFNESPSCEDNKDTSIGSFLFPF